MTVSRRQTVGDCFHFCPPWDRFWIHSHELRCQGSVVVYNPHSSRDFPVEPPADKDSCAKSVTRCIRKGMPLYTAWRRYYKPVRWMLRHNVAPHNMMRRHKLMDGQKHLCRTNSPPVAFQATCLDPPCLYVLLSLLSIAGSGSFLGALISALRAPRSAH